MFALLAAGRLAVASDRLGIDVPPEFLQDSWLWEMRHDDLRAEPWHEPWLVRAVVDQDLDQVVGHAGFHGSPEGGVLTVAYTVLPALQGRGYAKAALALLISEARRADGVHVLRATISPDNAPSLRVIAAWPFKLTGEHFDEVDGRELVFDLDVTA